MPSSKVLISLPPKLLSDADEYAKAKELTRSELMRRALKQYLALEHRLELRAELKRGYIEMAQLNSELAEDGLPLDEEAFNVYERSLRSVNKDD